MGGGTARPRRLVVSLAAALAAVGSWLVAADDMADHLVVVSTIAGWSFVGSGLIAWEKRPGNRIGPLLIATGFAWFLRSLIYAPPGPLQPVAWTVGWCVITLYLGFMGHTVLAFPTGRLTRRFDRWLTVAIYAEAVLPAVAWTAYRPPQEPVRCDGCGPEDNLILISADQAIFDTLVMLDNVFALLVGGIFMGRVVQRWRRASPVGRRVLAPFLLGVLPLVVIAAADWALVLLGTRPSGISAIHASLYYLAVAGIPVGLLLGLIRTRVTRSVVGDLVVGLSPSPSPTRLRELLAQALGDPSLELGLSVGEPHRWVDVEGRPLPADLEQDGRVATVVESEGQPLALLVHDALVLEDPGLIDAVGAAARLALENVRLQAEVRAQLNDVRASRARLVETGDAERKRLERDLHDGAQQRLVSLALRLKLAQSRAPEGNGGLDQLLAEAAAEAEAAVGDLRELARGIHPATLTREGLAAALETLAERSPIGVDLQLDLPRRLPEPVEATAYFVCAEALVNVAKHAGATQTRLIAAEKDGALCVEVGDDGAGGADVEAGTGLRGLQDRVQAVGGRMTVRTAPGGGTTLSVRLPLSTTADVGSPP